MIDSSYLVPSDPNSMRDSGPLRNAVYTLVDPADEDLRKTATSFKQLGEATTV